MDTLERIAEMMSGQEYPVREPSEGFYENLKQIGVCVVFGASDDLMEFRGAINDEVGAYEGTTVFIKGGKLHFNGCDNPDCPNFSIDGCQKIEAIWDKDGCDFVYETEIPHAVFYVKGDMDDEVYCKGIVFRAVDVQF